MSIFHFPFSILVSGIFVFFFIEFSELSSTLELFVILAVCSDGSVLFRFGNASEIREKVAELDQQKLASEGVEEGGEAGARALLSEGVEKLDTEVNHNLVEEIESSSTEVVGVADQNLQLPVNEKKSVVLDNDSETAVINDSQEIDRQLMLDSVEDVQHGVISEEDVQHGIVSEDVAAEGDDVPSVSEEDSEADNHKEIVVSTATSESDMISELHSVASGEVEEKEEGDIVAYLVSS